MDPCHIIYFIKKNGVHFMPDIETCLAITMLYWKNVKKIYLSRFMAVQYHFCCCEIIFVFLPPNYTKAFKNDDKLMDFFRVLFIVHRLL